MPSAPLAVVCLRATNLTISNLMATAVDQVFPLHFCVLQSNQKLDSGNAWERGYLHRKLELGL